jgi:predicted Zn-dependent protease
MLSALLLLTLALADSPTTPVQTEDPLDFLVESAPSVTLHTRTELRDFSLPVLPPQPCVPELSRRAHASMQVDLGDEAKVGGDLEGAAGHYRAAIALDNCNAFAWAALGQMLLDAERVRAAVLALETTTRLMPGHFHAWTQLGEAREALGLVPDAVEAFHRALALRVDHRAAAAGLARVGPRGGAGEP